MARAHLISSPIVCSVTNGDFWVRKLSFKSISCASSGGSKTSQHKIKTQIQYDPLRFQLSAFNHHKSIQNYAVKAVTVPSSELESEASNSNNIVDSVKNFMAVLYQFIYPYALYGQATATISASLVAVEKLSDISPLVFIGLLQAVLPHSFMVLYANGVNQVFNFEIDKINKPYLPLAAGKLSFRTSAFIVALAAILGLGFNLMIGSPPLIWNFVVCVTLWTCYSVNTFVLKRPLVFTRSFIVFLLFMSFYSPGIALAKDIPDVEGDIKHGVDSFAARLGQKNCLGNVVLGSILWYQTKYVDVTNPASTRSFYSLIWKLMMGSYVLLPLIR
ncbi:Glycinol 4-dimethylallyltransferase [Vigna angularis]|uniref:Glycinol 4-dimethylallyltransferase n=1 Tax=Phaseolus angularis TaxID=3914 RepID=A0A8T0KTU2_PHAAN|nr:Glycinol 4-dimethylallyltransferase [Vigna angularis]